MSGPARFSRKAYFGDFELNVETAELRNNGNKVVLPGKPFQILVTLLDRPGELVTREELKIRLWPSGTFVDFDQSLNKAVNRLREALKDSAERPRFIETLPRRGYRFIHAVQTAPLQTGAGDGAGGIDELLSVESPTDHGPDQGLVSDRGEGSVAVAHRGRYIRAAIIAMVSVAVVVFAIFRWGSHPERLNVADVQIAKLTDSGRVRDVAISPDGRYVVYSLASGDGESLHLRQVATGSDVEILSPGPGFHGLTFSPDGTYVYFVRSDPNEPFFKYLYSVAALGGHTRQMIADVDSPVSFSPDGSQFVFERAVASRNVVELRIANADGSSEHTLATIQNGDAGLFQPGPSWSSDGRTIVCPFRILGKEVRWMLASVPVLSGVVREIYSDQSDMGHPVWLSKERLLMPRYDAIYDKSQLWVVSFPDGKVRRFTNDLTDYNEILDITRDGTTVVAVASTVASNVWEAPAGDLSRAKQVTFGQPPMSGVVEGSNHRLLSSATDGRVWTIKPDGRREAFGELHDVGSLRACGTFLLFVSFEGNTATLARVKQDGSGFLKLASGDISYPGCSPDGKFAYYVNRHRPQRLWRISTDGGSPVEIGSTLGMGLTGWLEPSPNGKLISYPFSQYHPNGWKLAVVPARGGPAIRIFDLPGGASRVRWTPAGTSLLYLVTKNGATNIWEQSLMGGKSKQVTRFSAGRIFDFNWSSDYKRLLLTRGDVTSDVVLFSNLR